MYIDKRQERGLALGTGGPTRDSVEVSVVVVDATETSAGTEGKKNNLHRVQRLHEHPTPRMKNE